MKNQTGTITPALLVIAGAFIIVIYALLFLLTLQLDFSSRQVANDQALHIAEAGVNYYRWHLAHDPLDFQDGTGGPGPYVHTLNDPQGAELGEFSLEITPPSEGSSLVKISSTGATFDFPNIKRTVEVEYGLRSFASFSFLSNASSWYGTGITVNGDIHSNNGIRMDGTNTGRVTSAKETYMCGSETGCFPPTEQPGVWGQGGDQSLWEFPVGQIDFNSVSLDFATMKTASQQSGVYLPPSGAAGYRIVFSLNGTATITRVTGTDDIRGYNPPGLGLGQNGQGGCRRRYQLITSEDPVGTFNINDSPIIFVEDQAWIEGTLSGRTTVAAARFPLASGDADIWIPNNILYANSNGQDALGIIAQNSIYFTKNIPNDFRIDAALMAQNGQIIRHGYFNWCGGTSNAIRNSLTINGSIISFQKSYWNYGNPLQSGFQTRTISYDGNLLFDPPPYFPTTGDFEILTWKEK